MIIRNLSNIEQAFTMTNGVFPLSVVCVLHLTTGPDAETLKQALEQLQSRHQLLRSGINKQRGTLRFKLLDPVLPIELTVVKRTDSDTWRGTTENALNTTFNNSGPLMKCLYLPDVGDGPAELIVCFHHAIIDGISARLILHELLSLCGGLSLPERIKPGQTCEYPPEYQKWNFIKRLPVFLGRQMKEEWTYSKKGVKSSIPRDAANAILSFRLSPEVSRKLSVRIGREGLSLNSVLLALISLKVYRHRHQKSDDRQARVISFADLRSSMRPPVSNQELGCYVSMLRFSIPISSRQSVFSAATNIRKAIFKASRQGDVFMMSIMSKYIMRMVLKFRNVRLGLAALSFIGKLDLEARYGRIHLHNVNAFISNNPLGAEFSAFGKILFGSIGVDFNYLSAEISEGEARSIVDEIKNDLEEMANISSS